MPATFSDSSQPILSPYATADAYVENRLKQYQSWYDKKAVMCKVRFLRMRTLAVGGSVLVPVVLNVPAVPSFLEASMVHAAGTVLSVLVAMSVAMESVYHYKEQWKNYRSTEQFLGHEVVFFVTKTGPYEEKTLCNADPFKTLVDRVEGAIASENASTLSAFVLDQSSGQKP